MDNNIKISVCIPTYEAGGKGVLFLQKNLEGILKQTYNNFEIIISDHSKNNEIENYVSSLSHPKITYFRYKEHIGKPAYNTNNAIRNSSGDYIKIMNQDDYIESDDFFQKVIDLINQGTPLIFETESYTVYNNSVTSEDQIPTEMELHELPEYGDKWALRNITQLKIILSLMHTKPT